MVPFFKGSAAIAIVLALAACASNPANLKPTASASTGAQDRPPLSHPGASFTQDDLKSTGKVDVSSSLRTLDPALQMRGY